MLGLAGNSHLCLASKTLIYGSGCQQKACWHPALYPAPVSQVVNRAQEIPWNNKSRKEEEQWEGSPEIIYIMRLTSFW